MSEVKTTLRTLLSILHSMLTSRSQIWYTIFVGPPAFAGAAADKLRHWDRKVLTSTKSRWRRKGCQRKGSVQSTGTLNTSTRALERT